MCSPRPWTTHLSPLNVELLSSKAASNCHPLCTPASKVFCNSNIIYCLRFVKSTLHSTTTKDFSPIRDNFVGVSTTSKGQRRPSFSETTRGSSLMFDDCGVSLHLEPFSELLAALGAAERAPHGDKSMPKPLNSSRLQPGRREVHI